MAIALRPFAVLAALAPLACDVFAERVPRRHTPAVVSSSADTIVRQVVRVRPRASAMQRVTGHVRPRQAFQPLDSTLAIRVLDQRGGEMRGVPVRWRLGGNDAGAELRVIDGVTDSAGLSRAAFTTGRSASSMGPIAEVAGVGRIDFGIAVRVHTIRVEPASDAVWSGDDVHATVSLSDEGGNPLTGGRVRWTSTDTSVLRVGWTDSLRARLHGRLAGRASIVAWIDTTRGSARISVRPVVAGRFETLDGSSVPALTVQIQAGPVHDSISAPQSRFTKRVELPPDADVELRAMSRADGQFHPVHLRVRNPRELQDLRVVLVPTSWRIDAGAYAGRTVAVDAGRALRRVASGSPFWRLVPISGNAPTKLLGWREADLPLRVAFDRSRSDERITAEDSIAFWSIAAQLHHDLGVTVFAPADTRADTTRRNFVGVQVASQAAEGHTFVAWNQEGDASDGTVILQHARTLRDPHVVTHELVHLLGFGHSTSWTTVLQPMGGHHPRLTPEDVAYIQLGMRLRRVQERTGARPGLPVASQ